MYALPLLWYTVVEVVRLSDERIERSVQSAIASIEMEGYQVDSSCIELCRKMLKGEMTIEEYIALILAKEAGEDGL